MISVYIHEQCSMSAMLSCPSSTACRIDHLSVLLPCINISLASTSTSTPYRQTHTNHAGERDTATGERLIGPRGTISRQTCGLFHFLSIFAFLTIIISLFFCLCLVHYCWFSKIDRYPRALKAAGCSRASPLVFVSSPFSPSLSLCFVQR